MGRARTQPLVLAWALPGPSWPILWGPLSGLSVLLAWASLSCSLPAVCIALFLVTFTFAVRLWFVALRLHPAFARTVLDLRASPHLICPHRCYSLLCCAFRTRYFRDCALQLIHVTADPAGREKK